MISGNNILGLSKTVLINPVNISTINSVSIKNAIFDDLYITKNPKIDLKNVIPAEWDFDTLAKAKYEHSLEAGNVEFMTNNTTALIIKRRLKNTFTWAIVTVIDINFTEDFNFVIEDRLCTSNKTYEYSIVPYVNGTEGRYISVMVDSHFKGLHILNLSHMYSSYSYTLNTEKNKPRSVITVFGKKYSFVDSNGEPDYYNGDVEGLFLSLNDNCEFDTGNYREHFDEILDFLNDGNTKVLKVEDGRIFMCIISGNPSDTFDKSIGFSNIRFPWTEVGYMQSTKDLYDADLIDFRNMEIDDIFYQTYL